jgi:hypothetical protein
MHHLLICSSFVTVCFKYFGCFRRMFQVFHPDVAYVDMALPTCFKRMFRVLRMFHTYVASVLSGRCKSRSGCCICCYGYTRMFQVFYLFQTYVTNILSGCFKSRLGCCTSRTMAVVVVGTQPWVSPHGFPVRGARWAQERGSCDGRGRWYWGRMQT